MLNNGPSGFAYAPVTKMIVFATGAATIAAHVFHLHPRTYTVSYKDVDSLRLHKFLLSALIYSSPAELFFGTLTLYWSRLFERQRGSRAFATFAAASCVLAAALECAYLAVFRPRYPVSSGAVPLSLACAVLFSRTVPVSLRFRVAGLRCTDKLLPYLVWAQLLFCAHPRSTIAGVSGILAGILAGAIPLASRPAPRWTAAVAESVVPFATAVEGVPAAHDRSADDGRGTVRRRQVLTGPVPAAIVARGGAGAGGGGGARVRAGSNANDGSFDSLTGGGGGGGGGNAVHRGAGGGAAVTEQIAALAALAARAGVAGGGGQQRHGHGQGQGQGDDMDFMDDVHQEPEPVAEPSESDVENLMAMGFDRDSSVAALRRTHNNVEAAVSVLLG